MSWSAEHFSNCLLIIRMMVRTIRGQDLDVVKSCGELIAISGGLDKLLASGCDTDEIEGFEKSARLQAQLIEAIARTQTFTIVGLMAKAECALLKPIESGYDGGIVMALSVCRDINQIR